MAITVPQLALVTDVTAAAMENTLVSSRVLTFQGVDAAKMGPKNRFQTIEEVPPRYNPRRNTGDVSDLTAGRQDTFFGSEVYQLNNIWTTDCEDEDFLRMRDLGPSRERERLEQIGRNAGEDIDAELLGYTVRVGNNQVGTPGAPVSSIEALQNAYVRAKEEGVADQEMMAVLAYNDYPALSKYLLETARSAAVRSETILGQMTDAVRDLLGLKVMFTQQLPTQVSGTRTNGTVNGAAQNVSYASAAISQTTNGHFLTQTLNIAGVGANATIEDGAIFTIAGVNAYDNRKKASLGRLQQFRVVGATTANAAGEATIRIFPAIIVPTGAVIGSAGVNNANATVTAAPANGAAVTFLQAPNTSAVVRSLIAGSAVKVFTSPLGPLPSGETQSRTAKGVPLTLRVHRYSNGNNGRVATRFDVAYQPNVTPFGRFKVIRVNGN